MTATKPVPRLLGVFLLVCALICALLAAWQGRRMGEKQAMLAGFANSFALPPRPLAQKGLQGGLYDRVSVHGQFDHSRETFIRTSRPLGSTTSPATAPSPPLSGAPSRDTLQNTGQGSVFGVLVLTPFFPAPCAPAPCENRPLLVDRGFVQTPPDGKIPPFLRPEGAVTLQGVLRASEAPGWFQPSNNPRAAQWFSRDVAAIAAMHALPEIRTDLFLQREAQPGEQAPYGLEAEKFIQTIANNHFEYALTWGALSLTSIGVLFAAFWRRRARFTPEQDVF